MGQYSLSRGQRKRKGNDGRQVELGSQYDSKHCPECGRAFTKNRPRNTPRTCSACGLPGCRFCTIAEITTRGGERRLTGRSWHNTADKPCLPAGVVVEERVLVAD